MNRNIAYFYLTILRHGETSENIHHVIQGHLDTELSNNGVAQAKAIKQFIDLLDFNFVISSDLKRAKMGFFYGFTFSCYLKVPDENLHCNIKTAYEVVNPNMVETETRLRERNFGDLCGHPRSVVQQFTEENSRSGAGCDGWRAINAECAHEVAVRTYDFLLNLCIRLSDRTSTSQSAYSNKLNHSEHPILGQCVIPSTYEIIHKVFGTSSNETNQPNKKDSLQCIYAGNILIVSHGGWIRQFLRLLALHSEQSFYFPKKCVNSVINNCAICQIGIAFDTEKLKSYLEIPRDQCKQRESPLPIFGNLLETPCSSNCKKADSSCPYSQLANPQIPIITVCYHFNITKSQLDDMKSKQILNPNQKSKTPNPSELLCSRMEVIFSDDGDEYAGLPVPPTRYSSSSKNPDN